MGETIRVEHSKDYTVISNKAIRDSRLSFRARGLHHLLLSYPDGWKINIEHLAGQSEIEGKDAIATALRELEKVGYLTRIQKREKGKIVGTESVIRELPIANPPEPKGRRSKKKQESPQPEKPDTAEPDTAEPDTAEPDTAEPDTAEPDTANPLLNKYVFDQSSNQEVSTPPNPQNQEEGAKATDNQESEVRNQQPENSNFPTDQKPELSDQPVNPHEGINSAAPLNRADKRFVAGRPQNPYKNCGLSVAEDPWMQTAKNPDTDFAQWVADNRYADKSKTPLADAKAEIRNNSDRAADLWEEYQLEIAAKAQKNEAMAQIPLQEVSSPVQVKKQGVSEVLESNPELKAKADSVIANLRSLATKQKITQRRAR